MSIKLWLNKGVREIPVWKENRDDFMSDKKTNNRLGSGERANKSDRAKWKAKVKQR